MGNMTKNMSDFLNALTICYINNNSFTDDNDYDC